MGEVEPISDARTGDQQCRMRPISGDTGRMARQARFNLPNTLSMDRAAAYRSLLQEALPDEDLQATRHYPQQQHAWSRDDFHAMVEAKTQRFAGIRPAHRPRSDTATR